MGILGKYQHLLIVAIAYFFIQLQFWFPIWVVFLFDRGLDIGEIVIADIIYWTCIVLLEFPMGVLSDRIGRRKTFFVAALFGSLAYYLMLLIHDLPMLLLSWFMWAVYISTISGTDTAYIYELILESGLIHRTKHILGYFDSIRNFALLISTIFAGYLYVVDMRLPITLNSIFALLSAFTILLLPKVKIKIKHAPIDQIRLIRDLFDDQPSLRYLILFMALIYTYIWASTLLLQPLLQSFDISIRNFGLIYASFPFFAIFGGLTAGSISDKIGDRLHIIITTVLIVISMGLIGILPGSWGVIGIIFLQFSYSLLQPVLLSLVNNQVRNDLRASVLSFSNLIGSFGLIFCRPLIVLISEITSVQFSYLVWGVLGLLILLFLAIFITLRNSSYQKES